MSGIITFDPSGTTQTGYFRFENYQDYEFGTIEATSSVEHGKKIDILIKNKQPQILAWEYAQFFRVKFANNDLLELVYINGIINYIACVNNIPQTFKIVNLETQRHLNNSVINGLELRSVPIPRGRPKKQ